MKKLTSEFSKIKSIYNTGKDLKLSDFLLLIKSAKLKRFNKGDLIMEAGSHSKEVFYFNNGLARMYVIKENGDEVTVGFRRENQVIGSYDTILFERTNQVYIQALEPTTTLSIDYDTIFEIMYKSPVLMKNLYLVFADLLKTTITRLESFVLLTPEERYFDFVKNNPELVKRIHDKHLANFLGITPVSISRIKSRQTA